MPQTDADQSRAVITCGTARAAGGCGSRSATYVQNGPGAARSPPPACSILRKTAFSLVFLCFFGAVGNSKNDFLRSEDGFFRS